MSDFSQTFFRARTRADRHRSRDPRAFRACSVWGSDPNFRVFGVRPSYRMPRAAGLATATQTRLRVAARRAIVAACGFRDRPGARPSDESRDPRSSTPENEMEVRAMAKVVLMVGTRKGCFLLESDEARADWEVRGPFCEGWPIYHAVHDADSGAIYAAAASEWHGAGVWRTNDLGENWELSSEGLEYGGRRPEAVEDLRPGRGARARARGQRGGGHLREQRRRRHLVAAQHARRPAGPRRLERAVQPAAGPSRHAGHPARTPTTRTGSTSSSRASASSRRPTTARRGRRATRDCARSGRGPTPRSASASTSS